MRLVYGGIIAMGIIISLSIGLVLPAYLHVVPTKTVLLSFNIVNETNLPSWCIDLASYLKNNNLKGSVFISGKIAEKHPECVTSFDNDMDIGTQTYSYIELPTENDYLIQLEEVKKGKAVVDDIGNLDSRLFKAPNGNVDENIYSLLSRSGILADFSYDDRYHKYHNEKFLTFDLESYDGLTHSTKYFDEIKNKKPLEINFYNYIPQNEIKSFISDLKDSTDFQFVTASELTGLDLTPRKRTNSWL